MRKRDGGSVELLRREDVWMGTSSTIGVVPHTKSTGQIDRHLVQLPQRGSYGSNLAAVAPIQELRG